VFVVIAICLALAAAPASANDGVVISRGDTLHPLTSTVVQIRQEKLQIAYNRETQSWDVMVVFDFYNPTRRTVTHKVAFVNRSLEREPFDNRVRDFVTRVNGLETGVTRYEEEPPADPEAPPLSGKAINEYFAFDISFPPGLTEVRHSYRYYGSIGWGPDRRGFYYVLETAKAWNGPIGSFHLRIDLPDNSILSSGDWEGFVPFGTYTMKREYLLFGKYRKTNGLFIRHGGLSLDATNYVPPHDLFLEVYDFDWYLSAEQAVEGKPLSTGDLLTRALAPADLQPYTRAELRLLRNAVFAWHGRRFQDASLGSSIENYIWYIPSESTASPLTAIQARNVEAIKRAEAERER
jgi:hypothetical protein